MPSFSQRPGFPSGLRVLLVDSDDAARARTEEQLRDCNYEVTSCASCAEAVVQLSSSCTASFDILLADKSAIGCAAAATAAATGGVRIGLLESCKGMPCILMSSDPSPHDVMTGISLGAVDFLAKPLSPLKLRNIWQHTVRKMMSDMRICNGKGSRAAAGGKAAAAPAVKALDRSASNVLTDALAAATTASPQQQQTAAPSCVGLPPRSPGSRSPRARLHARRSGGAPVLHPLRVCISSTNLAASPAEVDPEEDEFDFDFGAAEAAQADNAAAAASDSDGSPRRAVAGKGPTTSGATAATAATATATHVSVPAPSRQTGAANAAPSCGVPVPGALAPLSSGMVWGMPMPVVRAPGIVPPNKAPSAQQQSAPAPMAWGYMGCPMPPPAAMMAPHPYMMMMPPPMCGMPPPPFAFGAGQCYPAPSQAPAAPQQQQQYQAYVAAPPQQQQPQLAATGAAVAQALDASLMSLLGSAEDDDLDVDLDDVLQQVAADGRAAADACCGTPRTGGATAADSSALGSSGCYGGDELRAPGDSGAASPCSLTSEDGGAGALCGDLDGIFGGGSAPLGQMCGGLGLCLDDCWGDELALKKSASLADLLAVA